MDGGSCHKFRLSTATASNKSRPARSGSISEWRLAQQSQAALRQPIPRSLGDLIVDPNDMLSRVGVMNPKAFWQWYHLPDRGDARSSVWLSRADSLWGEALWPYILQDELVLSTSIPIILEKAAAYTGRDYTKSKRVAAFNAITSVCYNFTHPGACSFGGLAIALSGMTHLAIQQNDYPAAFTHLNAITRLLRVYQLEPTEWLCCAWSDLRTVSAVGESPRLPRSLPARWERSLPLSIASLQSCQDLASRNVCACKQALSGQVPMAYAIFRRLHELQHAFDVDHYASVTPMAEVYEATYEACELHAIARIAGELSGATYQMELIAITLKLCAWERCATLIPRCGDIERRLVGRALEILIGNWPETITEWKASASIQVLLWVLLATTATAYAHVPEKWQSLLALWRVVIATEKSTTWSSLCGSLESWPCAHWWFTPVLERIFAESSPSHSSWQVLGAENTSRQPAGFLKCLVFGD